MLMKDLFNLSDSLTITGLCWWTNIFFSVLKHLYSNQAHFPLELHDNTDVCSPLQKR